MKKSLMLCAYACLILCLTGCGEESFAKKAAERELANKASFAAGNSEIVSDAEKSAAAEERSGSSVASVDEEMSEKPKTESVQDENGRKESPSAEEYSKAQTENRDQTQLQNQAQAVPPSESLDMTAGGDAQGTAQAETNPAETASMTIIPAETMPTEPAAAQEQTETFDVTPYVEYAKSYAESIGLLFDSTATECWDNPITANAKLTNIKENIRSRLDRYKNIEGFTGVWVWTEKVSDAEYEIYIGYY